MSDLSPFLKHVVTFAFLKLSGKMPVLILKLKIFVKGAAISSALSLKNLALRPSGPVALVTFRDWSCFLTNASLIVVFKT